MTMADQEKKHPVTVEGFDGTLQELAQKVCAMRYDQVAEFFFHLGVDLDRQMIADRKRNRTKLASLLYIASDQAFKLKGQFDRIFQLCKPHMHGEL